MRKRRLRFVGCTMKDRGKKRSPKTSMKNQHVSLFTVPRSTLGQSHTFTDADNHGNHSEEAKLLMHIGLLRYITHHAHSTSTVPEELPPAQRFGKDTRRCKDE